MAVTTLCGDNLRALCPLVLDALDSRQWRGVLAELIEGADPDLSARLQLCQTYELTLKALDCGRYYEHEVAHQCRGLVMRYEASIRAARSVLGPHPLIQADQSRGYYVDTLELCQLPRCRCAVIRSAHYGRVRRCCVRRDHILALVWRGLDGQVVPWDVESGLAALRESIRSAVSKKVR